MDRSDEMAHYVISDIHGESSRFHDMLKKIRFSGDDTLYILGDVVDRGPDGICLLREIMASPNMVMLLGNHENMMLEYLKPDPDPIAIRRWDRNGNRPTLDAYRNLGTVQQQEILAYLQSLSTHMEITVGDQQFYLVHGFPGSTVHDETWFRPEIDTPNPVPGFRVIIGHTPVQYLIPSEEERMKFVMDLESKGEHLRICRTEGFIDIDCGCGQNTQVKALACLCLEDDSVVYS